MDIRSYNREAWDRQVEGRNPWTIPVSPQKVADARSGQWGIFLVRGDSKVETPISTL